MHWSIDRCADAIAGLGFVHLKACKDAAMQLLIQPRRTFHNRSASTYSWPTILISQRSLRSSSKSWADAEPGEKTWRHSRQMAKASSNHARNDTDSMMVGVIILGNEHGPKDVCNLLYALESSPSHGIDALLVVRHEAAMHVTREKVHLIIKL